MKLNGFQLLKTIQQQINFFNNQNYMAVYFYCISCHGDQYLYKFAFFESSGDFLNYSPKTLH